MIFAPRFCNLTGLAVASTLALVGCASSQPAERRQQRTIDFESSTVGQPPVGFTPALDGGGGPEAWIVREDPTAPSGRKVLRQESADSTSYRFLTCVYDGIVARDVKAEVEFKAISGDVDEVAGIVLRYSPGNYYVARAHAFNDNVVLFKMVQGNRVRLREAAMKVTKGEWHRLGFEATGNHLEVTLDGTVAIELDDTALTGAGKVGLWTKADSVTAFDDLRIDAVPVDAASPGGGLAPAPSSDVDAALERSRSARRPALLVVTDSGASGVDVRVRDVLRDAGVAVRTRKLERVDLDLASSRSRAAALRFHVTDAPALLAFSPGGLLVARLDKLESAGAVGERLDEAERAGPALDETLARLEASVDASSTDVAARRALADFLLAHESWRAAIPHLEALARRESADVSVRVLAWVDLAHACFAIGEPEKGRRVAKDLLATLGPTSAEARAAGHLLLGVRDGELGRGAVALEELRQAVRDAPDSVYGKRAREEQARLGPGAN